MGGKEEKSIEGEARERDPGAGGDWGEYKSLVSCEGPLCAANILPS